MIDIEKVIAEFLKNLTVTFGDRIYFAGLQGSYGRGEATETSDIDLVVILDTLSPADINTYSAILDSLPNRNLICGFLSGKRELLNWEPSDLFQFYYDTKPLVGSLYELLPLIDDAAVEKAIKIGVCNIHHGCVHNMLFEKSEDILKGLYKSASFVMQAICFKETGKYIKHLREIVGTLSPEDSEIIETFLGLKEGSAVDFKKMSEKLFLWSKKYI